MPPGRAKKKSLSPGAPYRDPRGPDGVTILAPYEQAHPSQFPGIETGDVVTKIGLFDLGTDPAEQRNLAARHPDVVQRLREQARQYAASLSTGQEGRASPGARALGR